MRWRRTGDAGPRIALSLSICRNAHGSSVAVGRIEELDHRLSSSNRIVDMHYRRMEQVHSAILIDIRLEKDDGYGVQAGNFQNCGADEFVLVLPFEIDRTANYPLVPCRIPEKDEASGAPLYRVNEGFIKTDAAGFGTDIVGVGHDPIMFHARLA